MLRFALRVTAGLITFLVLMSTHRLPDRCCVM